MTKEQVLNLIQNDLKYGIDPEDRKSNKIFNDMDKSVEELYGFSESLMTSPINLNEIDDPILNQMSFRF